MVSKQMRPISFQKPLVFKRTGWHFSLRPSCTYGIQQVTVSRTTSTNGNRLTLQKVQKWWLSSHFSFGSPTTRTKPTSWDFMPPSSLWNKRLINDKQVAGLQLLALRWIWWRRMPTPLILGMKTRLSRGRVSTRTLQTQSRRACCQSARRQPRESLCRQQTLWRDQYLRSICAKIEGQWEAG